MRVLKHAWAPPRAQTPHLRVSLAFGQRIVLDHWQTPQNLQEHRNGGSSAGKADDFHRCSP